MIGGVGLIKNLKKPLGHNFKNHDNYIILIGKTFGHLEQSCYLKENFSIIDGKPPEINLFNEKNNGEAVLNLIQKGLVFSIHDVSSGGLITALSEMSMGTEIGVKILKPKKLRNSTEYFFGEDQSRYILEVGKKDLPLVEKHLTNNGIYYENIGITQKKYFEIENEMRLDINVLYKKNNEWYNSL